MTLRAIRRTKVEMNKKEISSLIKAYMSLGGILSSSLENIDPDEVRGIEGMILKLTIHSNYFSHVARSIYQKLDAPPPEIVEKPEDQKIDPANCNHMWETMEATTCVKCGINKLDWEAGRAERQEESNDSSARVGPEEDG